MKKYKSQSVLYLGPLVGQERHNQSHAVSAATTTLAIAVVGRETEAAVQSEAEEARKMQRTKASLSWWG